MHIAIFNSFFSHYCYCYCNSSDGYCQCLDDTNVRIGGFLADAGDKATAPCTIENKAYTGKPGNNEPEFICVGFVWAADIMSWV